MLPYIKGDKVIVPDRKTASTLINKGHFGTPLKGGGLELNLIEATYLVGAERLTVKNSRKGRVMDHGTLLSMGTRTSPKFLENYLVFREIRNRGINIQGDTDRTFLAYPRGMNPSNGKANVWISVFREHDSVKIGDLYSEARKRSNMRMDFLVAVVDGDFDITYYSINITNQDGELPVSNNIRFSDDEATEVPGGGMLTFTGDIDKISKDEGMGTDIDGTTVLSIEESAYLTGNVRENELDELKDLVYRDLHSRGFLVRTGFKYGSHFRAYSTGSIDDHSDLLVHCSCKDEMYTWEGLARAIRLSNSVRKRMLYGFRLEENKIGYLELGWTRP